MAIDKTICTPLNFDSPIEVKLSKSNTPVPVVDGIHLHSIYNPSKEAVGLIAKYEEAIAKQNKILVLGLGFGYHVWQLESILGRLHKNFEVIVIEPDIRMYDSFKKHAPVEFSNKTRIVSANTISEFYDDINLVKFMAGKPLVVPHAASFNLREDFFKKFMSFNASNELSDVVSKVHDVNLRNYLLSLGEPSDDFDTAISRKSGHQKLAHQDHFLNLFKELTSGARQ
tara:strand:- start:986 stop:1666 length:681 start_codon:yes stop_codon:yes gene_type:complete